MRIKEETYYATSTERVRCDVSRVRIPEAAQGTETKCYAEVTVGERDTINKDDDGDCVESKR